MWYLVQLLRKVNVACNYNINDLCQIKRKYKLVLVNLIHIYLTIFIRRVTLNTELDTVFLFVRHGQRTHFGVYPLVCPFSTWPGQGFYVELFLIGALNRLQRWQRNKAFLTQTFTNKRKCFMLFRKIRYSMKYRALTDTSPLVLK